MSGSIDVDDDHDSFHIMEISMRKKCVEIFFIPTYLQSEQKLLNCKKNDRKGKLKIVGFTLLLHIGNGKRFFPDSRILTFTKQTNVSGSLQVPFQPCLINN